MAIAESRAASRAQRVRMIESVIPTTNIVAVNSLRSLQSLCLKTIVANNQTSATGMNNLIKWWAAMVAHLTMAKWFPPVREVGVLTPSS